MAARERMDATVNNWEAAFSLSDTARQRVLCSSRLRHRPPSPMESPVAKKGLNTTWAPVLDLASTGTNSHPQSLTLSHKRTPDDGHTSDDAAPPRKQPNNPSSRKARIRLNICDDKDLVRPSSSQKDPLSKIPHSTNSGSEDGENVDRHARTTAATSTHASIVSRTHRSRQKGTEVQMETSIDVVFNYTAARLKADFFQCDALELAPKLLGKFLRKDEVVLQITEVEAYRPNDSACHGRFGVTPRTAAMFGPGGHAYVYLCYGMHVMLNIVADVKGVGAAALIRACAPVAGMQTIQTRRGISSNKPILLTGPGKVGQALGLTTDWSNHPLYTAGGLELLDGPPPEKILVGPRVGIQYATPEDTAALWRFAISGTPWISAPRNTLAPQQNSA